MKKILLIISLCFVSILAISQNYEPFLLGKTYRYLNPKDSTLILQKIDSVSVNVDGDSVFYSLKKQLSDNSTITIQKFVDAIKYVKTKNYYLFFHKQTTKLIANPSLNQIWKMNQQENLFLQYKGKIKYSFLTLTDSVKVYYVLSDSLSNNSLDTIYLSKNYGFVNGFEDYSLFSISELKIGLPQEINYNPTIGDTLVYVDWHLCPTFLPNILDVIKTQREMSLEKLFYITNNIIFNYGFGYIEYIKKGEFYYRIYGHVKVGVNLRFENILYQEPARVNLIYKQNTGLFYEQHLYEGPDPLFCDQYIELRYQKGDNYEFGDRKELDKILAVDENVLNSSIKIYPNPSNGIVNIALQNQEVSQVSVLDSKGVEIYHSEIFDTILTLKLNAGIYIVKIINKCQVFVNKLVVE